MPKVAINKVAPSWLTKWRKTRYSTNQATANITAPAKTKAIKLATNKLSSPVKAGIHSAKRAMAKAANSTIAPWAKLNTPDALKMSTKPRATREYNMPAIRPPIKVSRKNPMSLPMR